MKKAEQINLNFKGGIKSMKKIVTISIALLLIIGLSSATLAEGTRDNPYLTGDTFVLEDEDIVDGYMKFEFELLDSIRGEDAYQFLIDEGDDYSADSLRETAEKEDKEILLAKYYAKALELEEEPHRINPASLFDVMDSTGSTYNRESASDTNNPFRDVDEVYEGGEITGWVTFLIPEEDSPLLLVSVEDDRAFIEPEVGEEKRLINLTLSEEKYDELAEEAENEGLTLQEYLSRVLE